MTRKNSENTSAVRSQWAWILLESALVFAVIYAAALYDLPKNEYVFFLAMLPLYHAGVRLGFTGSVVCGIIITLLFLPLIPTAKFITEKPGGLQYAAGMIAFINIFGIFVGGAIGRGRLALRDVDSLFHATDAVTAETDERELMIRLLGQALALCVARYAAVLVRTAESDSEESYEMLCMAHTSDAVEPMDRYDDRHPLVVAAREKKHFCTNSALSSDRFTACPPDAWSRSFIAVPVFSGESVYGAVMVAGLTSDDVFTNKTLAELQVLADTAAVSIENIEQETQRQQEAIREEQMRELFSRYVSSSVADYVLKNPELLESRRQRISVIVSDIRSFTSLCETMTPQEIVSQLNEYFTCMVDVIMENRGTIDKFIGDCIIAYWGAPAPDQDHAPHAAHAALQMRDALEALNSDWAQRGLQPFNTGIGVHTCDVFLGNLGDNRKKTFTILGEQVDRAMKIESLTKDYGVGIIVTGETRELLGHGFQLTRLQERHPGESTSLYELKRDRA